MEIKKGVLFDLEGTLIESGYQKNAQLLHELHKTTYKELLKFGIPENILTQSNKSVILRNLSFTWVEANRNEDILQFAEYVNRFMSKFDMMATRDSKLYNNTIHILNYLKNKNYKIGLCTNTSKQATNIMLKTHKIYDFFDIITTREDVLQIKPDPIMIINTIKQMKTKKNYMVGDSKVDIISAKNAGIKTILIKRDNRKQNYYVDYTIYDLLDLKRIL